MVSKIRELCKKNKTSIAALERQLGFGNGVIGRWDKSVPNYDRLYAVAEALGVTVAELTDDQSAKKDTTVSGDVDARDIEIVQLLKKLTDTEKDVVLVQMRGIVQGR